MHKITRHVWTVSCLLLIWATTFAQSKHEQIDISKIIKIQDILRAYGSLGHFSGVVLVAKDGEPIFKYTGKYANLDYKVPSTLSTRYNSCAITQTFTATAVMQLVEQGKIDLSDKLDKYIVNIKDKITQDITIHQLLNHTAGLKDYYSLSDYVSNFHLITDIRQLVTIIADYPLEFTPGTHYKMSNSNYVFLAAIIEKVTGTPYKKYIEDNILTPCKMEDSGLYSWVEPINNSAVGYTFNEDKESVKAAEFWAAHPFGADGIYITAEDLLKFMNAFTKNQLISEKSQKLMTSQGIQTDSLNKNTQTYFGWLTAERHNQKVLYQGNYQVGLSTQIRHYEDSKYTIIVLSNYFINRATELADKLELAIFQDDYLVPRHPEGYFLASFIERKGIDYVVKNFDRIVAKYDLDIKYVWPLNSLGQDFLASDNFDIALEIFKINQERFPKEPIAYDSMGECHYLLGNYDKALENFRERLRMIPNDKRSKAMIDLILETKRGVIQPAASLVKQKRPRQKLDTLTALATIDASKVQVENKARTSVNPILLSEHLTMFRLISDNLRYFVPAFIQYIEKSIVSDVLNNSLPFDNESALKYEKPVVTAR